MKFFQIVIITLLVALGSWTPVWADDNASCGQLCEAYKKAHERALHPTTAELVCVNFTLPEAPAEPVKVVLKISRDGKDAVSDSKAVKVREAQFCYPKAVWLRAGGEPDEVVLCSEHKVILHGAEISSIISGRGTSPASYACLRGVAGCGGEANVSLTTAQLQ